ncbi:MAG: 23S rRNA (adenine(2503)-C(2))-methyltransferase RlmN, partial [Paracoccaceae bacterium]
MNPNIPITQDVKTVPRTLLQGTRKNIIGLTRSQLLDAMLTVGTPSKQAKMRLGQLWQWVYHWGLRDFTQMTNLSKEYRLILEEHFYIELPDVVTRQISADGTRKYLVRIQGGHEVETVY